MGVHNTDVKTLFEVKNVEAYRITTLSEGNKKQEKTLMQEKTDLKVFHAQSLSDTNELVFELTFADVGHIRIPLTKNVLSLQVDKSDFVFCMNDRLLGLKCDDSEEVLSLFSLLLTELTTFTEKDDIQESPVLTRSASFNERVAAGINKHSDWVADTLHSSAHILGKGIRYTADSVQARLAPAEETVAVHPFLKRSFSATEDLSSAALSVSSEVVGVVLDKTSELSKFIFRKLTGGRSESAEEDSEGVTKAAVNAIFKILSAMDEAGRILINDTSQSVVKVIHHKYGPEVAEVSASGFGAVKNSYNTYTTAKRLGIKTILKTTAKRTAVDIVKTKAGVLSKKSASAPNVKEISDSNDE